MNNPELELRSIILTLTENDDAKKHKATVDRYFTRNVSFKHPLCNLPSGPNSREQLKNIYAVYKFFTRDIHIEIQKITIDSNCTRAVIELTESLSAAFLPIWRVYNLKIITVLDLERVDNRFYIKRQYGTCRRLPSQWIITDQSRCLSPRSHLRGGPVRLPLWVVQGIRRCDWQPDRESVTEIRIVVIQGSIRVLCISNVQGRSAFATAH